MNTVMQKHLMLNKSQTLPLNKGAITVDWLNRVLSPEGFQPIQGLNVKSLNSNGGDAHRIELQYGADLADEALIDSVIIKLTPHDNPFLETLRRKGMILKEVYFYQNLAIEVPLVVPDIYFIEADSNDNFVIIMQDLGDVSNWHESEVSAETCFPIVSALAKLHGYYWNHACLDSTWLTPLMSDVGDRDRDLDRFYRGASAVANSSTEASYVCKVLSIVAKHLAKAPEQLPLGRSATLIHGDFHKLNVALIDQQAMFFDWQLVERGQGVADLANFLVSSLDAAELIESGPEILRYYYDALIHEGVKNYRFKTMLSEYRFQVFLLVIKMATGFGLTEHSTQPAVEVIEKVEVLARHYKLLNLARMLPIVFIVMRLSAAWRKLIQQMKMVRSSVFDSSRILKDHKS